ncbi:hypothetical protein BACERE00221_02280 [Bacillus paranthracis]|uniref:Uncharacterized protein n=1 Tax=Bacillus paranthracis TaxID=2026186 RepID=A0A9X8X5B1_9BACI|nr:hypothetical protein BACERE00221_02280 [Bacillus paranthracis]
MSHIICPHLDTIYFLHFEHTILILRNDERRVKKKKIFGKNTLLTIDEVTSKAAMVGLLYSILKSKECFFGSGLANFV